MPYKDRQQQKEAQARAYQANKDAYYQAHRRSLSKKRKQIDALKNAPCLDCGQSFPPQVMAFHHRDPQTKLGGVSNFVRHRGIQAILDEIAKCDLLCANCHILRHINTAL